MDATVHGPGDGERHAIGASSVTIKAGGEESGGSLFVAGTTIEPGFACPPPHRHRTLHDCFYVLEGTLTLRVGDETVEAGTGTFACVPPGVVHTFANRGAEPARFLNLHTPGGWEGYMRDLGRLAAAGRRPTPDEIGAVAARYDFEVAE